MLIRSGMLPRIHGELNELGIDLSLATLATYMTHQRKSPRQTWWPFLGNHVKDLICIELFSVTTVAFRTLFYSWYSITTGDKS